jgi:hypothetical protein
MFITMKVLVVVCLSISPKSVRLELGRFQCACAFIIYYAACEALASDLGRSRTEAAGELQAVLADLKSQVNGLKGGWMNPEPRTTHMLMTPGHTEVIYVAVECKFP